MSHSQEVAEPSLTPDGLDPETVLMTMLCSYFSKDRLLNFSEPLFFLLWKQVDNTYFHMVLVKSKSNNKQNA